MNFIDIVVIIVLLLALWQGYGKGMMKSLVGLVGNLLAIGIAYFGYRPIGELIDEKMGMINQLAEGMTGKIPLPDDLAYIGADQMGVGQLYTYLEESGLPEGLATSLTQQIHQMVAYIGNDVLSNMAEVVAVAIAEMIYFGVVFFVIWGLMSILIHLVSGLVIGAIHMIPLVGSLDRVGGAIVNGALFSLVITISYGLFGSFIEISKLSGIIDNTTFGSMLNQSFFLAYFGEVFDSMLAILFSKV